MTAVPSTDFLAARAAHIFELAELSVRSFCLVQQALDAVEPALREVVQSQLATYTDKQSTEQERQLALHTLLEALFPQLALDLLPNPVRDGALAAAGMVLEGRAEAGGPGCA